jgi:dienelactone hydrolase
MTPMKKIICSLVTLVFVVSTNAAIQTQIVDYKDGDTMLEGVIVFDDTVKTKRPGVLIVHQWMGLSGYEKKRAEMLAQLGYVAFCADIYGKGVRPASVPEASDQAGKYKGDRALLRSRVNAGLVTFKKSELLDTKRVAAVGYCFGGTTVIELARSGAELSDSPAPADGKNIKTKVLACHGADDPFVPAKDLAAFQNEMKSSGVDWQLVQYGGAVHSFTDWNATGAMKGAQYNEKADKRSWEDMKQFFGELFK